MLSESYIFIINDMVCASTKLSADITADIKKVETISCS